jgi:uncharacterized SAM-binding protein YcdF (DUF218 family)
VNDIFVMLGIEGWKPMLGNLLLPPMPFLVLILVGARLMYRRRLLAWSLLLCGVLGSWACTTSAVGTALTNALLTPPRPLSGTEIAELRKAPKTAIVVLGAGRKLLAPEYRLSTLKELSVERLRFAIWLSRETSLPVLFSGGVGHGAAVGPSEAEIAARIAEREFNHPLRWTEGASRDTNENAYRSLALLQEQGIQHVLLVTHSFHMRRALAAFERAKLRAKLDIQVTAAPMDVQASQQLTLESWLPSVDGFQDTRIALHEWMGRLAGA